MGRFREAPIIVVIMILLTAIFTFTYIMYSHAFFSAPTNMEQMMNQAANITMNTSWFNWYHNIEQNSKMMFQYGLATAVGITIVVGVIYLLDKGDDE
jgi:hypothetical protein